MIVFQTFNQTHNIENIHKKEYYNYELDETNDGDISAVDKGINYGGEEKEEFTSLLDAGCGPAPMISLLAEKYPNRHYTGLDLTPAMIEQAKKKNIPNAEFVVGDCENFPFDENSFDAIICSNSFHHYPNPQAFFYSVKKCLRPGGRLILSYERKIYFMVQCGLTGNHRDKRSFS